MPALLELQRAFAAGLRDRPVDAAAWAGDDGIPAAARLRVYRNNSRSMFDQALELTFPVLCRRVGSDYFRQLAHHYRAAHPSPAGDLHDVGRAFAAFLEAHLDGTPYAWLAELARLEWACAESAVAADAPSLAVTALAELPPESLESVRFGLHPSLCLVASELPVFAVWSGNRSDTEAAPVDLGSGPQWVCVYRGASGVELRDVSPQEFRFVEALLADATLGEAIEESRLELEALPRVLQHLFGAGLVTVVRAPPLA